MAKFFCISDVHGFCIPMVKALKDSGFERNNSNHYLICCGDCFDRGDDPEKVMEFLNNLPRKILIKGNHEDLLKELCERQYPIDRDFYNGTAQTVHDMSFHYEWKRMCRGTWDKVEPFYNQMIDYFETENYIFTHAWVPIHKVDDEFKVLDDWRNASSSEWEDARWENGIKLAYNGVVPDKTVVCGHIHTSHGHNLSKGTPKNGKNADYSIYYGNGIIAIDGCTVRTDNVNVLVIEDEFLSDKGE